MTIMMAGTLTLDGRQPTNKAGIGLVSSNEKQEERVGWRDTVISDIKAIDLTWHEAAQLALDRQQ